MLILNFAHPFSPEQVQQIEKLANRKITEVRDFPVQLENGTPFAEQVREIVDSVGLSPQEWQNTPILVNLPSYNFGAVVMLVELHGRIGHFPDILRTRPVPGSVLTAYEVAEIINLQSLREATRAERR